MNRTAVVTGASGLLGSYITEVLVARGYPVRALTRAKSDSRLLENLGVPVMRGDLTDPSFASRAIAGANIVFHCAGRTTNWGPWRDFEQGNIVATENVVAAANAHSVDRLVHVSSMAVYGHPKMGPELLTEDDPIGQNLWSFDYYNRSKIAAELATTQFANRTTIVRPTWFYGPRDKSFIPRVLKALRKNAVWIIGSRTNQLNGVYVTDLARACVEAGLRNVAAGQSYNLCAGQGVTQQELFDILCEGFELPKVRRRVPLGVAHHFAHLIETAARITGQKKPPSISRHSLSVLSRPPQFSNAKARLDLDWQPKVLHQEGLARTIEWIKQGEVMDEPTKSPLLLDHSHSL
ncbi:NAD-dependent epimerase/dehydratase family protein [Neorhodopirellula lusitana]|uniref:NAD-dependent epimerase/dehydratase family protein n=1 Tax=Neorhodopirellula lusitana TaxID=445327 RepID=UPI00384B51B1